MLKYVLSFLSLMHCICLVNAQSETFNTKRSPHYYQYQSLSFIPLQLIGNISDEVDVTVGIRYERTFTEKAMSLSIPLTRSMVSNMTYFSPGLKVFLRDKEQVRFFMMPQLYTACGNGEWPVYKFAGGSSFIEYQEGLRYKVGFLMNMGVDFLINDRLFMDASYGWGLTYYDRFPGLPNRWKEPRSVTTLFQLSCSIGYKF